MFKFDSEEILEDSKSGSFTWGFMRLVFYGWYIFSEYDGQSPAISRLLSKKFLFLKKEKTYVLKWKSMWLFVIDIKIKISAEIYKKNDPSYVRKDEPM